MKKWLSTLMILATSISTLPGCGISTFPQGMYNQNLQPFQLNPMQQRFQRFSKKSPTKKWTIAIHMAADNNLYSAGLDDINEMEAGLASPDVNLIVLFDGAKRGDSKIYEIQSDSQGYNRNIISKVVEDNQAVIPASKEIDSGDPAVFHKFMDWVTQSYPAEKTAVVIWNHGSGIYRAKRGISSTNYPLDGSQFELIAPPQINNPQTNTPGTVSSRGFASDDRGGEMQLRDLNPALATAARNLGKKVDILGFDTCLMGYMETAYQVKDLANYLLASEELEPGDGWDYHAWAKRLSANPNMSPAELGATVVETFGESYRPGGSQRGEDITLSTIDINAMTSQLVPSLNNLANELTAALPTQQSFLASTRNSTQTFYNSDSADLGDFLSRLRAGVAQRAFRLNPASIDQVHQALKASVVSETHYGNAVKNANGLQLYFPKTNQRYNKRYDDPKDIRYAEQPQWGTFLKAFTN